ncbi:MAG TPA: D-lyxose/D-mannose family sugar isomerase [Planctomycetota bacterium]|nr:D-lyxose/D-mannose family sugar isomerase [Planctomycetota bacterium]
MKRSQINRLIDEARGMFARCKFALPPWAHWSPAQWARAMRGKNAPAEEIRRHRLGWDLTDFGHGRYGELGLLLFTIRNGRLKNPVSRKSYAEKIMLVKKKQVTPLHFHWLKTEDIINRGGGTLVLKLVQASKAEGLTKQTVTVSIDGIARQVKAGGLVRLKPGESITLTPRLYHAFWAEGADTVVGEVSSTNDDNTDNRFYEKMGRFPTIEEDVKPKYLLCHEYPGRRK